MNHSSSKNGVGLDPVSQGPDACQMATGAQLGQDPSQRTGLAVLNENVQYWSDQEIPTVRYFWESENAFPEAEPQVQLACRAHVPAEQVFDVPMAQPEPEDGPSCTGSEGMVFENAREVDTSMNSDVPFLLDLSTVSPMLVDAAVYPQSEVTSDWDTNMSSMTEYAEEIHQYLRETETQHRPKAHYLQKQLDITNAMRRILVDWLVDVAKEYQLLAETLYLAVNYLDRFLSCMSVLRGKLQLVGTAAILLASKYEEMYPPGVDEFVYITDDTYTRQQLLQMEQLMLKVLTFNLTVPTIHQFLLLYLRRQGVCSRTENMAKYVAELSLLEANPLLKYLPSLIAAAAYCLANYTINKHFWPETLAAFTGYSMIEIKPCLIELHWACLDLLRGPQQAIQEKYKASRYLHVSLLELPVVLPLQ